MFIYIFLHIHIYIYICIHTYINVYIYIYTCKFVSSIMKIQVNFCYMCACVRACAHACARMCARALVLTCVRVGLRVCVCMWSEDAGVDIHDCIFLSVVQILLRRILALTHKNVFVFSPSPNSMGDTADSAATNEDV